MEKNLIITGIRGLPAAHGGFETFAEYLSLYLTERGWNITVYCQEEGHGKKYSSMLNGINLIHIPVASSGKLSTIIFDFISVVDSLKKPGIILTLGYNTAIFNFIYRLKRKINIINMDGIEWKRKKWGICAKTWFWINEKFGCWFGHHLIADHPEIKNHLSRNVKKSKITMIPYGAERIESADKRLITEFGLSENNYAIVIARPEPENSIIEIVTAFSKIKRNSKLVILGRFDNSNSYHNSVKEAASDEVLFLGAIYDKKVVNSLRFYAKCYVHGHQVGGTNPSLVEALGASNAIIAHDNKFNRWVAKNSALYFSSIEDASTLFDYVFNNDESVDELRNNAKKIFRENFTWGHVLYNYEQLLISYNIRED